MKRRAEVHIKPLSLTDMRASKQSKLPTQTTLKDHYRVVKPRSDLRELMDTNIDRSAGKAVTLLGDEVESPSVLGKLSFCRYSCAGTRSMLLDNSAATLYSP